MRVQHDDHEHEVKVRYRSSEQAPQDVLVDGIAYEFDLDELQEMSGESEDEVLASIAELACTGMIVSNEGTRIAEADLCAELGLPEHGGALA